MFIVMIDGKIRQDHPCFKNCDITQYCYSDGKWQITKDINGGTGHGTAIANILTSQMEKKMPLINFCVFDEELKTTIEKLISALEYIYYNIDTSIINLSLGSLYDNDKLYDICRKLNEKNIILVSGFDNNGAVSFPAAYDCVLGVDISLKCVHKNDFVFVENDIVNLRAMGGTQRVAWNEPNYAIVSGTSFATAHVTKEIISKCYGQRLNEINKYFKKASKYIYNVPNATDKNINEYFDIYNAALFPFSKEMQSLMNFKHLLKFQIEGVYDIKYSGNIGLLFKTLDKNVSFKIKNIEECQWDKIDTFILGHVMDFDEPIKKQILENVIINCLKNKVNLFCLDLQVYLDNKKVFDDNELHIGTAWVNKRHNKFGKLYKISRPILAVFGTSSGQGKFTLQLQLRHFFQKNNYCVGQLGTEPTSLLFDMDACLPIGFNSPLRAQGVSNFEYIGIANYLLHSIDLKAPDIIITGCQSNTVPILFNNLRNITLDQINYLIGINPDAVILCVNPYDHFDYIQRSIQCIEGLAHGKVIAIALYPFTFENNWAVLKGRKCKLSLEKILIVKQKLNEKFKLPVYEIGNFTDVSNLFEQCIEYFS